MSSVCHDTNLLLRSKFGSATSQWTSFLGTWFADCCHFLPASSTVRHAFWQLVSEYESHHITQWHPLGWAGRVFPYKQHEILKASSERHLLCCQIFISDVDLGTPHDLTCLARSPWGTLTQKRAIRQLYVRFFAFLWQLAFEDQPVWWGSPSVKDINHQEYLLHKDVIYINHTSRASAKTLSTSRQGVSCFD